MNSTSATPGELTILIGGVVAFAGSFLSFYSGLNAWSPYLFPLATLIPIYGIVMAAQIAITKFAKVRLPRRVLGFTWEQVHLVLGVLCGLMAVGWSVTDIRTKGAGFWWVILGGIALAFGAVNLQRERNPGAY